MVLPADVAEIVEQKHIDGILSYYVHYVDRKHASGTSLPSIAFSVGGLLFNTWPVCLAVDKRLDEWVTAEKVSEYDGMQTAIQPLLSHTSSGFT